jgi:hypothetical protein
MLDNGHTSFRLLPEDLEGAVKASSRYCLVANAVRRALIANGIGANIVVNVRTHLTSVRDSISGDILAIADNPRKLSSVISLFDDGFIRNRGHLDDAVHHLWWRSR